MLVVLFMAGVILGIVFYLNLLLLGKKIFSDSVNKWIWALAIASFGLFVSFLTFDRWLDYIGALPPFVGIFLIVAILLTVAIAFIEVTLLNVLKRATMAVQELEEVI